MLITQVFPASSCCFALRPVNNLLRSVFGGDSSAIWVSIKQQQWLKVTANAPGNHILPFRSDLRENKQTKPNPKTLSTALNPTTDRIIS